MHVFAAALTACGAAFAQAQVYATYPGERVIIIETRPIHGAAIHSGAATLADQALADEVAIALHADRRLSQPGITATIVANNGNVTLSGSTDSNEQAQRAERLAKRVAGAGHVTGFLSTTGG
jgi:osmotically-inducible protein OsmY